MRNLLKGATLGLALCLTALGAQAVETVTYLDTDLGRSIPLSNVACLAETDQDDVHFDIVAHDGTTIQGVAVVTLRHDNSTISEETIMDRAVSYSHATATVTITAPAGLELRLVDTAGRTVKTLTTRQGRTAIDVSTLAPGIYVLSGKGITYKFIKD